MEPPDLSLIFYFCDPCRLAMTWRQRAEVEVALGDNSACGLCWRCKAPLDPRSRPQVELTVYFDADCSFCRRVAKWLDAQPKLVPVRCVAAQSDAARACTISLTQMLETVTVTASDGALYRGTNAWIVVLWALRRYRRWSLRFATPRWRPAAERLFATIAGFASLTRPRGLASRRLGR